MFARQQELVRLGASDRAGPTGDPAAMGTAPFVPAVADYYQTNVISRASAVMAECTQTYVTLMPVAAE